MGNMASASVAFTMPMGDRFPSHGRRDGSKYHFDRTAWNDYGVFGNASFRLNDRLSLNAFGQYYINQQFHSVAAMPFLGSSSYGGTLGWRASDKFSLDVGARRLYDPYTGRWRTLPVVQPTINLFGAPISFDAGPLDLPVAGQLVRQAARKTATGATRATVPSPSPMPSPASPVSTPTVPFPSPTPSATDFFGF